MKLRRGFGVFIAVVQSVLLLGHFILYETWIFSAPPNVRGAWLKITAGLLSVSFVGASLLAFRYNNAAVRVFYRLAAVWLGLASFLFFGAIASWIIFGFTRLFGGPVNFHILVESLYAAALLS
jgi:hypothetical protein